MDVNWWVQHSLPPVTTSNSYCISRQTHRHLIKFGLKMPSTLLSFGCCAVVKQVDLQQQLRHCWKSWHRTTRTQTSPCNVYYAVHDNLARTVLLVVLGWQLQPCIGRSRSMDHGQRFLATRWRFLASWLLLWQFSSSKTHGSKVVGMTPAGKDLKNCLPLTTFSLWILEVYGLHQLNSWTLYGRCAPEHKHPKKPSSAQRDWTHNMVTRCGRCIAHHLRSAREQEGNPVYATHVQRQSHLDSW